MTQEGMAEGENGVSFCLAEKRLVSESRIRRIKRRDPAKSQIRTRSPPPYRFPGG